MTIARHSAEAATEGGSLAFGAVRVSESETQAIREVAQALGVNSTG